MSKTDKKRANSIISKRVWQGNREYTVHGVGTLIVYPDKMSAECRAYAMGHGIDQRVCDAAALSRDTSTGKSATPQEKFEAMRRIVDHLNSGSTDWAIRVAASAGPDAGLTLLAMMRALGKTLDDVEALVAATMKKRGVERGDALKIWMDAEQVAQAALDIKRERLTAKKNAVDLVAEMMGGGEGDESDDETDDQDGDGDEEAPF